MASVCKLTYPMTIRKQIFAAQLSRHNQKEEVKLMISPALVFVSQFALERRSRFSSVRSTRKHFRLFCRPAFSTRPFHRVKSHFSRPLRIFSYCRSIFDCTLKAFTSLPYQSMENPRGRERHSTFSIFNIVLRSSPFLYLNSLKLSWAVQF